MVVLPDHWVVTMAALYIATIETTLISGNVELARQPVGNILFHKADPKWNVYVGIGVGYHNATVESDLLWMALACTILKALQQVLICLMQMTAPPRETI